MGWIRGLFRRLWPTETTRRAQRDPASARLREGEGRGSSRPGVDAAGRGAAPLSLHLGIDFGTRFTKVCFRDIGRERSGLVTFAGANEPALEMALLPSALEIVGGRLACCTSADASSSSSGVRVEFLKLLLAQLDDDGGFAIPRPEGYDDQAIESLAAFYLAHVIRRSRRWIEERRGELLVGRKPEWSVSVGVPVQFFDSVARDRFQRVLEAAAKWADTGPEPAMSVADVRITVTRLRGVEAKLPCTVVPEITAAVRSFVATPGAPEGVYLYLDVGAGTLDGVSFRFLRVNGRPQLKFYVGTVEPLGVSALAIRLAPIVQLPVSDIEARLRRPKVGADLDRALDPIAREIRRVVAGVILAGKGIESRQWSAGLEELAKAFHRRRHSGTAGMIPLFVGGGGSLSSFYRRVVDSTYDDHRLEDANVRRYALASIPQPRDLEMAGVAPEHFHRFAIAYGLSVPPEELPEVTLPSQQEREKARPRAPLPRGVVPYGDSKDAYC